MEGHYIKNFDNVDGRNAKGRLRIEASNLPEFYDLLQKAEKEACQLKETISRLHCFEFDIDFSVADANSLES